MAQGPYSFSPLETIEAVHFAGCPGGPDAWSHISDKEVQKYASNQPLVVLADNDAAYVIRASGEVWRYDIDADLWSLHSTAPEAMPSDLNWAWRVSKGVAHIFTPDKMWEYKLSDNTWTYSPLAALPSPARQNHAYTQTGQRTFVFGGFEDIQGGQELDIVDEYDYVNDQWVRRAAMPETSKYNRVRAEWNGKIYLLPYTANNNTPLWEYDPETDSWKTLTSPPGSTTFISAAARNGKLYAVQRWNADWATFSGETWEYDISQDIWTQLASIPQTHMPESWQWNNYKCVSGFKGACLFNAAFDYIYVDGFNDIPILCLWRYSR